jgi:hypothetical protein
VLDGRNERELADSLLLALFLPGIMKQVTVYRRAPADPHNLNRDFIVLKRFKEFFSKLEGTTVTYIKHLRFL